MHANDLIDNRVGVLVILGTPDTVIEANRIVATAGSEAGIRIDDGPGTSVRENLLVSSPDVEPFDIDDPDVELTSNQVDESSGS